MKNISKSERRICIKQVLWWAILLCLIVVLLNTSIQRIAGKQPMLFGWGCAVIQTGSMEPDIPVGSLIIIHEKDEYSPKDVITYRDDAGRSVTHRVISISGNTVVTKGDSNNVADEPFDKSQIIGRVQLVIPGGKYFPVVIITIMLIVWGVCLLQKKCDKKGGANNEKEIM